MLKTTTCLTIATLINLGTFASKASAQLTPQQCHNAHIQIFHAHFGSGIPSNPLAAQNLHNQMLNTTQQFYAVHPECAENIDFDGAARANWGIEGAMERDRRHMEFMQDYVEEQRKRGSEIMELLR